MIASILERGFFPFLFFLGKCLYLIPDFYMVRFLFYWELKIKRMLLAVLFVAPSVLIANMPAQSLSPVQIIPNGSYMTTVCYPNDQSGRHYLRINQADSKATTQLEQRNTAADCIGWEIGSSDTLCKPCTWSRYQCIPTGSADSQGRIAPM